MLLLDLVQLAGGQLQLSAMPPREGELAEVRRICLAAEEVRPGDVFWCLSEGPCDVELAFLRGAAGVVSSERTEPWPGRFHVLVADPVTALDQLAAGILTASGDQESFSEPAELKVLQLQGPRAAANFPPTCERLGVSRVARRCRRTAA
jgi:hypothetical protein